MDNKQVFAGRLLRLALTDKNGAVLGRMADVLLAPAYGSMPPRVLGFVVNVQRRRIFVNAGRVATVGSSGVSLKGGTVDLRHFQLPGSASAGPGERQAPGDQPQTSGSSSTRAVDIMTQASGR